MSINIQSFGFTAGEAANLNLPTHTITAIVDQDGQIIADYTGANAIQWPAVLALLSADQRTALMDEIAQRIVLMKAGVQ